MVKRLFLIIAAILLLIAPAVAVSGTDNTGATIDNLTLISTLYSETDELNYYDISGPVTFNQAAEGYVVSHFEIDVEANLVRLMADVIAMRLDQLNGLIVTDPYHQDQPLLRDKQKIKLHYEELLRVLKSSPLSARDLGGISLKGNQSLEVVGQQGRLELPVYSDISASHPVAGYSFEIVAIEQL